MSRIDFAFGAPDRLRLACEVVQKQFAGGRPMVVYCADLRLLKRFDLLLWGFDATAFIPHVATDDPLAATTPVLLASTAPDPPRVPPDAPAPWLLNLDADCPGTAGKFERVLEVVSSDEADVQAARQRWRHYKTEGHALRAHDVSAR